MMSAMALTSMETRSSPRCSVLATPRVALMPARATAVVPLCVRTASLGRHVGGCVAL
uniref:Alternative protein HPN n=1 Tax=Homo sapiens TaxID=9606 RepID=L8E9T7_HUMAN|nr:alternative protein HPN [Homo sapiens]